MKDDISEYIIIDNIKYIKKDEYKPFRSFDECQKRLYNCKLCSNKKTISHFIALLSYGIIYSDVCKDCFNQNKFQK